MLKQVYWLRFDGTVKWLENVSATLVLVAGGLETLAFLWFVFSGQPQDSRALLRAVQPLVLVVLFLWLVAILISTFWEIPSHRMGISPLWFWPLKGILVSGFWLGLTALAAVVVSARAIFDQEGASLAWVPLWHFGLLAISLVGLFVGTALDRRS